MLSKAKAMKHHFLFYNDEYQDYFFKNINQNIIIENDEYIFFVDRTETEPVIFWAMNDLKYLTSGINELKNQLSSANICMMCDNKDKEHFLNANFKLKSHHVGYRLESVKKQQDDNIVKEAIEDDKDEIFEIICENLGKIEFSMEKDELNDYICGKEKCLYIIKESGTIAGIILGVSYNNGKQVFIRGLAVREKSRRKGYATKLLSKVLNWAYNKDIKSSMLWVENSNIDAISIYEKFGYQKYGDEEIKMEYNFDFNVENKTYYKDNNILIREVKESDLPYLFSWWINEDLNKHDPRPFPYNSESLLKECIWYCENFNDNIINPNIKERVYLYFIICNTDDVPIGFVNFFSIDPILKQGEMGIMIGDKSYWRKGIALKAVTVANKYIFNNFDIKKIIIETAKSNIPSINLFKKAGFQNYKEFTDDGIMAVTMELIK